jgi:hypothetical protein
MYNFFSLFFHGEICFVCLLLPAARFINSTEYTNKFICIMHTQNTSTHKLSINKINKTNNNNNKSEEPEMITPSSPIVYRRNISREDGDVFSRLGAGILDPTPGGSIKDFNGRVNHTN